MQPPALPFLLLAGEPALPRECHSQEVGCFPREVGVAHPGKGLPQAVTLPVGERGHVAKGRWVMTHLAPSHRAVGC